MRLFDRERDPEEVLSIQTGVNGALMGLYFLPVGYLLSVLFGVPGLWRIFFILGFSGVVGFVMSRMIAGIMNAAGNSFGAFLQPKGHATPYAVTYSFEQSLAARGDIAAAIAAYQTAMLNNPFDPEPRIQCAELHAQNGAAARAAELFNEARRMAVNDRARELYTSQRLVDLYLGPLRQQGRALVELRRLWERFEGTQEGHAARALLTRIKTESETRDPTQPATREWSETLD